MKVPYSFYECDIPHWFMGTPMHWHSEFESYYVIHGTGEFICGGEKYATGNRRKHSVSGKNQ